MPVWIDSPQSAGWSRNRQRLVQVLLSKAIITVRSIVSEFG